MTIQIISPLKMQWEDSFKRTFPDAVINKEPVVGYDMNLWMWCDKATVDFINEATSGEHIVFVRRYEWYTGYMTRLQLSKVKAFVFVNDNLAKQFEKETGIKPHVIYNGVNPEKWKFKKRSHGKKIAVVGYLNQKKNIPLALQIFAALPSDYELHIAGDVQDGATYDYIDNLIKSFKRKVYGYGHIPASEMDFWLEDKSYILSTAISEGCPNNVIEAMAKGIKPVVHNWPGSKDQFGDCVFDTVNDAVRMISPESEYDSNKYLGMVNAKFGMGNFEAIKGLVYA